MGCLIESSTVSTQSGQLFVESGYKDNLVIKKKKRRSRQSKQNSSISACSSASELCADVSSPLKSCSSSALNVIVNGNQPPKQQKASFSSTDVKELKMESNLQNQQKQPPPCEVNDVIISNPTSVVEVRKVHVGPILLRRPVDTQKYFPAHWSAETVSRAVEKGEVLRALFRVNAHNKLEAYCKIDGLQTDVLISGLIAQNRAMEGDTVAIVIDHPSLWQRIKGAIETSSSSTSQINSPEESKLDHCDVAFSENGGSTSDNNYVNSVSNNVCISGYQPSTSGCERPCHSSDINFDSVSSLQKLCALASSLPSKRPTGRVVAIMERSRRRDNIVGFLSVKQWIYNRESRRKNSGKNKDKHQCSDPSHGYVVLTPTDPRFTKVMVSVETLPKNIKKRLEAGDSTIENELVGVQVSDWGKECHIPEGTVIRVFGKGSDVKAQIASILFENAIDASEFSREVLSCLPPSPWSVPRQELHSRRDLRDMCVFTIDPKTASDLDDALSIQKLSDGVYRVGVHIADVSYFVLPDTALDIDAQIRSTTVYLLQRKLPMLPPMLSDNVASLNPGVDRLSFSIFWDVIGHSGEVLNRWIGRTVIKSCCKLSYEHAQAIIDGSFDSREDAKPQLHGQFQWSDVVESIKSLHGIARILRENRFKNGALTLDCPKISFLFDEKGLPYDSTISERMDSNYLVEEFMLLANTTAAEVITRAYPSCALLRRHPEPNERKLKELQSFCDKNGLNLDISSSATLRNSIEHIRDELKNDSVLFDILMSYAAKPMQLASYFCSGDYDDDSDRSHYSLATPLYTHFTSPLRRYPDIVVHRTLAAALEAEDRVSRNVKDESEESTSSRCFTGVRFDKDVIESVEAREALAAAALKHGMPCSESLTAVAAHCNDRKLASRHVKDATDKLYMWALLRKKAILFTEARVLGLGPRFMSIYIPKLAIERRIHYDEVQGLKAEWLDATSTLVMSLRVTNTTTTANSNNCYNKRPLRRNSPDKLVRTLEEVALIVNPSELVDRETNDGGDDGNDSCEEGKAGNVFEPAACFPLTLRVLSTVSVALHAVGGDDGPLDVVARLYVCSYL